MTTPVWPSSLPLVWTNTGTISQQTLITDSSQGVSVPTALRRLSRVPGATTQISWTFLEGEYKIFVAFWRDTLLNGQKWFYMQMPTAMGIAWCVVRCTSDVFTANMTGHRKWDVSMNIDIRERPIGTLDPPPAVPPPDPYWDYVILLLRGEGSEGSTSIVDSSKYGNALTTEGGSVFVQHGVQHLGGGAIAFAGGWLTFAGDPFDFNAVSFTVETWVQFADLAAVSQQSIFSVRTVPFTDGAVTLYAETTGNIDFFTCADGFGNDPLSMGTDTGAIDTGNWHFVSMTQIVNGRLSDSTNRWLIHVDGVLHGNYTGPINGTFGSNINIANYGQTVGAQHFEGYMQEYRVTRGIPRYSDANYDVPTGRFPNFGPT